MKKNIECDLSHTYKHMKRMSTQCRDLLIWMLEADPEERPSAKQAIGHQWFKCDKQVLRDLILYNSIVCSDRKAMNSSRSPCGANRNSQNITKQINDDAISRAGSEMGMIGQSQASGFMNSFLMGNNFVLPNHRLGALKDSMLPGAISALEANLQSGNYDQSIMGGGFGKSNLASGSLLMVPMASFKGRHPGMPNGLTSISGNANG